MIRDSSSTDARCMKGVAPFGTKAVFLVTTQRQFLDHRSIIDGTSKHAVHLHRKEDDLEIAAVHMQSVYTGPNRSKGTFCGTPS